MKRMTALLLAVFLPAALMIAYRMRQTTAFASVELIVYPLLFGGAGIALILLLKTKFLRESLSDFNVPPGRVAVDLAWGVALAAAYFVLFFLDRPLRGVLPSQPNTELLGLMLDMRENPWLLVAWFGPVLWIGIALYEELLRAFLLTTAWSFSNRRAWAVIVVILAAILFGVLHWPQGSFGIVSIAIKSIVTGGFYYYRRRLLPLVVAHVLYDGLQVAALLITYPR
jgi:membrane protease YdiL (CAAX protease family)